MAAPAPEQPRSGRTPRASQPPSAEEEEAPPPVRGVVHRLGRRVPSLVFGGIFGGGVLVGRPPTVTAGSPGRSPASPACSAAELARRNGARRERGRAAQASADRAGTCSRGMSRCACFVRACPGGQVRRTRPQQGRGSGRSRRPWPRGSAQLGLDVRGAAALGLDEAGGDLAGDAGAEALVGEGEGDPPPQDVFEVDGTLVADGGARLPPSSTAGRG